MSEHKFIDCARKMLKCLKQQYTLYSIIWALVIPKLQTKRFHVYINIMFAENEEIVKKY